MKSNLHDLARLASITSAAFEKAQADMADILRQEAALRENLAYLVQQKHNMVNMDYDMNDPARTAGADVLWQQWADQKRAKININLARIMALKDGRQYALRLAFGRNQAVQALGAKAKKNVIKSRYRKETYTS